MTNNEELYERQLAYIRFMDGYNASKAKSDKEIADLTTQNEKLRYALESIIESWLLQGSYQIHTSISNIAYEALKE